jgi:hypothetical protein
MSERQLAVELPPSPEVPDKGSEQARKDALIQQASLAFERDVTQLLADHTGEWVAYHGGRQIGLARTRSEAWQECVRLGLPEGEFWVFHIQPIIGVEVIGMGWTTELYGES